MEKLRRKPNFGGLLALLLFGVFAVCILLVLTMGADSYQKLAHRDQNSYNRRTVVQYMASRVHHGDCYESIDVQSLDGRDALIVTEHIGDSLYDTYIYCYDGYLCELFVETGSEILWESGEKILEAKDFQAEITDNGYLHMRIKVLDEHWENILVCLRSGREVLS